MKSLHFEPVPEVVLLCTPGVFIEFGTLLDGSSFGFTSQRSYCSTCYWDTALKMCPWDLMIRLSLLARVW